MMNWKDDLLNPMLGSIMKAVLWPISRMRLPQVKGTLQLEGLKASVEVLRDRWGVVHIYAPGAAEALFAQGFVHAQERLWQMDFTRRVVSGRLSEVLGEAGLPADRVMLTMSLRQTAEQEARQASGEILPLMNSYCDGVNAFIDSAIRKHRLPVEFMLLGYQPEHWQIADILSWEKLMCWTLAANWQSELYRRQIIQALGAEKTADLELNIEQAWAVILDAGQMLAGGGQVDPTRAFTGARAGEGVGSNNWVLHGSRTNTGKPLLANDMHLELTSPGVWFENHLCGGELDVTGVVMPGSPLVIAGHNRHVAWGFTDGMADAQDLYEEHLRKTPTGGWEYEYREEWLPAEVRQEQIKVKGGKQVVEEVVSTRHGPIINLLFRDAFPDAPPLALRWTTLEPDQTFSAILSMNLARDCAGFHEALRHMDNPSQNVVYADVEGNIGYTMNGRIPMRAKGDGMVPAPGWSGEYEWTGYVPFEELPHMMNPARGFIVTANNQAERPGYPHFIGRDYLTSERAGRIVELLNTREKVDIAYIKSMHYDEVAISARLLGACLGRLKGVETDLQPMVEAMRAWNGSLGKDSPEAAIFEVTSRLAIRLMLEHWLGELGVRMQGKGPFAGQWPEHTWEWFIHLLEKPDSAWFDLGNGEKRDAVLHLALHKAVEYLTQKLGPRWEAWKWGRLHSLTFGHRLGAQKPLDRVFNIGPFPMGGDGNTIRASFTSWNTVERRPMVGPPFRFIADLNDLEHCLGQLVPGQSGHMASRHFRDGVRPWMEGEYHPMLFKREDVEANLEARLVLEPAEAEG
jgi:penicillin G amidase